MRRVLLSVLFSVLLGASAFAQQSMDSIGPASQVRPVPDSYRYPGNETLHYTAEWRLWRAGEATLKLEQSGSEMHITGTADSVGVVAALFHVYDRYDSYFDRRSFCSSRILKHTEEGLHKRDTTVRFDSARRKAVLDERNLRNNQTKHEEYDTSGCVTDVMSGIYYLRTLPLTLGATYRFPLNDGGKTVDVVANVEAREDIKTDAGTFHTIRVQPSSESGMLKSRGKVWVWYTDDAAHIPVQMRSRLFWGTLTIRLTRVGQ